MAPGKEQALAFMPSPNDSIPTFRDIDGFPSPRSSFSQQPQSSSKTSDGIPYRQNSIPLSPRARIDSIEPRNSISNIAKRPSVSSASPMPHEQSSHPNISNEASWQQRYFTLKEHNDDVIRALRHELDMVRLELSNTRNDSVISNAAATGTALPKDSQAVAGSHTGNGTHPGPAPAQPDGPFSQKYNFDGQSPDHAEQLRSSSSNGNRTGHTKISNHLSSIPETSMSGQVDGGSESTLRAPSLTSPLRNDDDPPSPPTSANGYSPPNRRTLAGQTPPPLTALSAANNPSVELDDRDEYHLAGARDVQRAKGLDEDPALSEPHILQHADDFIALDRKLQRVASDPDMNPPAASSSPANVQADANAEAGQAEDEADPDEQGIKLKHKLSMNFGAPLGQWGQPR